MARLIGSIVPTIFISHLVAVAVAGMMGTPARAADECLAAPNAPSAKGNHWYYRIDRATQRKCWYQRAQAAGTPRVARPTLPPQVAEPASASEPPMKPLAFAQRQPGLRSYRHENVGKPASPTFKDARR